ncbi:hypothetical protein ACTQX1_08540 [Collinsella bouchesdurhonensis]|uniref:hypothetical protein n=1 Tax=Collinsella bouchesdurhonensis TaxID=1907654 RepID=UPI003F8AA26F
MSIGAEISRREFIAITVAAIAAGVLAPDALAQAEQSNGAVGLGRARFDRSYSWRALDEIAPPKPNDDYYALLKLNPGETVRLDRYDAPTRFRTDSLYPLCKVTASNGNSWNGMLDDKLGLDVRALKVLEAGHYVYAVVEANDNMYIDNWPEEYHLITLKLDVFVVLA